MIRTSLPSIVNCGTASSKNRSIYDAWAANYEKDIRKWGYILPEIVAQELRARREQLGVQTESKIRILDAGAGDGLSGAALRNAGWDESSTYLAANDISLGMLDIAKKRLCYDDIKVVDLNKVPLPYATDAFDIVTCTGTMTYVDPKSGLLEEFVRITRPGGLICYTNRTDKLDDWKEAELNLEKKGHWRLESDLGPVPYLPRNEEYGQKVEVVVFIYKVSKADLPN